MKRILFSLMIASALFIPIMQPAFAADPSTQANEALIEARLGNPLGSTTDARVLIGRIIKALLGISGALALVMFIYGGIQWMTSGGVPDKIKKGQSTLVWSVLGLIIIFGAYAIVNTVITALQGTIG